MGDSIFRIHPAIGIARVGNSEEYYIAPETMAALPDPDGGKQTGGLPIKPGTESATITDKDLRDSNGALKRQAARFRIYHYPSGAESYPTGEGTEITVGSKVQIGGETKTVQDVVWTAHLANKKANCYQMDEQNGIDAYESCAHPPLRNKGEQYGKTYGKDPDSAKRRTELQIDPGPRAIQGTGAGPVRFDRSTEAGYWQSGDGITKVPDYPKSFPEMHFPDLFCPEQGIRSLGELRSDDRGRLLVLGGYGDACGFTKDAKLEGDVNNDGWFDDTADGPVWATVVFDDGSTVEAQGAWVVATDPAYAPQTLNPVTLWDDVYTTFVENLDLVPSLYSNGQYDPSYEPSFPDDIYPIFRSAWMQQWNTNLPERAKSGHDVVNGLTADDDPAKYLNVKSLIRDPNEPDQEKIGAPRMPLALGDAGKSFLSVSTTEYFYLTQWFDGKFSKKPGPKLGPGELLDKATLVNCLGGRFNPGIDMTFIVRQPDLWKQDWQAEGPFRINAKKLDYSNVDPNTPLLTAGWFPLRKGPDCPPFSEEVEPGDTAKFMAIPWHTDYNSCATHLPSPTPPQELTLYWSWPAQRPVAVYRAQDVRNGQLGEQRFSVRGKGTATKDAAEVGRYQDRENMLTHWHKIGIVIQATAIEGQDLPPDLYLEVESQLDDGGNEVQPWPNTIRDSTEPAS